MPLSHRKYRAVLAGLFALWWVVLAIRPWHRNDWLLENFLVLAGVGLLAVCSRWLEFSRVSYTLIFAFLSMHIVGAHYTYSEVPYERWCQSLTGHSFNSLVGWQRNNFDRLIHFSYGLLLAYPIREVFLRVANVQGFWGYFLPLDVAMSTSMLYELIEWGVSVTIGGELGQEYLATQGDIWDSQKDMALASMGALVSMGITAAINWRLQRDFAKEWVESFRVKGKVPLGEHAIAQMLHDGR